MGLYSTEVVPRLINLASGSRVLASWRARACEGLSGRVVEVGFGAGHNLPFYPPAVSEVLAVEPSDVAWRLGERRREAASAVVTRTGLAGESVPLA
ncbi:MAG: SAM-dependent methyltransferase, partial [Acidobacteriota bacterium]|nr:SAM-dependent methyltransferase [Acidobacteriota bacterium]